MKKEFCDECEKEMIDGDNVNFFSQKFMFWGRIYRGSETKTFCTKKCFLKFIKEKMEIKE